MDEQNLAVAFGCRLRAARLARRLSQTKLAEAIGRPQTSVSAYERGARVPDLWKLDRLARATGVSLGWLVSGDAVDGSRLPTQDQSAMLPLADLPVQDQIAITTVMRLLVLLARERAQLRLDDADLGRLGIVRKLLQLEVFLGEPARARARARR